MLFLDYTVYFYILLHIGCKNLSKVTRVCPRHPPFKLNGKFVSRPLSSTIDYHFNYIFRFSSIHGFVKPNDQRALNLMNTAAAECMQSFPDIVLAYGESDEMS